MTWEMQKQIDALKEYIEKADKEHGLLVLENSQLKDNIEELKRRDQHNAQRALQAEIDYRGAREELIKICKERDTLECELAEAKSDAAEEPHRLYQSIEIMQKRAEKAEAEIERLRALIHCDVFPDQLSYGELRKRLVEESSARQQAEHDLAEAILQRESCQSTSHSFQRMYNEVCKELAEAREDIESRKAAYDDLCGRNHASIVQMCEMRAERDEARRQRDYWRKLSADYEKAMHEARSRTMPQPASETPKCKHCGGEGVVDSGGFTPWGSPINVPCPECTEPAPAAPVPVEIATFLTSWRKEYSDYEWDDLGDVLFGVCRYLFEKRGTK